MNNLTVINSKPGNGMSTYMIGEMPCEGKTLRVTFQGVTKRFSDNENSVYLDIVPGKNNEISSMLEISEILEAENIIIDMLSNGTSDMSFIDEIVSVVKESSKNWIIGQQISALGSFSELNRFAGKKFIYTKQDGLVKFE